MDNFKFFDKQFDKTWLFSLVLLLGNGLLLFPAGHILRTLGALLILFLPGILVAENYLQRTDPLIRWILGLGLSFVLILIFGLFLHYWPGKIAIWAEVILLDTVMVCFIIRAAFLDKWGHVQKVSNVNSNTILLILLGILCYGAFFRLTYLGYSEFQGDEVKALVPAAEAIEGRAEALFYLRKKGPGEILIPMMVWRLTGLINEWIARSPFAIVGLLNILTIYLLGRELFDKRVALIAATLAAANGFLIAFTRIVQYQQIVVWMSLLSILSLYLWVKQGQKRLIVVSGAFLGAGILAHYDAILVFPALALIIVTAKIPLSKQKLFAIITLLISATAVAGLFFVPYLLTPQVTITEAYLGERIGSSVVKNSLEDFFHFSILYNSIYYVAFMGCLLLGFIVWALAAMPDPKKVPGSIYILPTGMVVSLLGLALWPDMLNFFGINWTVVPFLIIFVGVFFSSRLSPNQRVIWVWFGVTFLGYNFAVADPRTHVYIIFPAWLFLAAMSADWLAKMLVLRFNYYLPLVAGTVLLVLFSGYLYVVYLRQSPEYETDWPQSQSTLYWFPYDYLSPVDTFGFVHKIGWKVIGGLYVEDQLEGDYQTNGLFEIAEWYTRHELKGCDYQAKQFFDVSYRLIDWRTMPTYHEIADISLPNKKGIAIYDRNPVTEHVGPLDIDYFNRAFDNTAWPSAFVRPVSQSGLIRANLANVIELVGYHITAHKIKPGGQIAVRLDWQKHNQIPFDLHVFVHLTEKEDRTKIWAQSNGEPDCGKINTSTWPIGMEVSDLHILSINPDVSPGEYVLVAGMFLPDTNQRVPILDENDHPITESIELTTVQIDE